VHRIDGTTDKPGTIRLYRDPRDRGPMFVGLKYVEA